MPACERKKKKIVIEDPQLQFFGLGPFSTSFLSFLGSPISSPPSPNSLLLVSSFLYPLRRCDTLEKTVKMVEKLYVTYNDVRKLPRHPALMMRAVMRQTRLTSDLVLMRILREL